MDINNGLTLIAKYVSRVIEDYKNNILPNVLSKYQNKIGSKWSEVIENYKALENKGKSAYFFASFAPRDFKVGSKFNTISVKKDIDISYRCESVILAILDEWTLIPVESVSLGHRCICLLDFPSGIPNIIRDMEEVEKVTSYKTEFIVTLSNIVNE